MSNRISYIVYLMLSDKEVELIATGDVQGVGYRQYVAHIGRKFKLAGYVKNLKDGTVQIHCKGNEKAISDFKKQINKKNPPEAYFVDVEDLIENTLEQGTIKQTYFEEIYDDSIAEMSQGFSTGLKYMTHFNNETQANLNLFRSETNANFKSMDEKYHIISENMIAIVNEIKETNKAFESRMEKNNKTFENKIELIESRMEKTEKNIESLLKILVQKK
jgi:acylphosphatase